MTASRIHWLWWMLWAGLLAGFVSEGWRAQQTAEQRRRLEDQVGDWPARLHRLSVEREAAVAAARASAEGTTHPIAVSADERSVRQYLGRIEDLQEVIARVPDIAIPEMRFLTPDDWIKVAFESPGLQSNADFRRALAEVRREAKRHAVASFSSALANYPGRTRDIPKDLHDLAELGPYCRPPLPPEILSRYELVRPGELQVGGRDVIIREKDAFAVDRKYDVLAAIVPTMGDVWLPPSQP